MTEGTVDGMGQLRPVVRLHIRLVAEATIGGRTVMEGVAPRTDLLTHRLRSLVASRASKTHGRMGLMREAPGRRGYSLRRSLLVAEAAVRHSRVVKFVTGRAGVISHAHGRSLMTQVAREPHVHVGLMDKAPTNHREGVRRDTRTTFAVA